ncbi:MAG: LysR family transcriptional regulator [Pseudomonadota bacterium]
MPKELRKNAKGVVAVNWDDLRVFLGVARAESLSAAGRVLRLDPATVGRRIARLEDRCGAVLLAKSPSGYALTEAGERLLPHAEEAERSLEIGQEALKGADETLTGLVRIGAPDGVANYLLPQVTADIVAENPGLDVQILALPRVFSLTKREADMAVTVSAPTSGRLTVQKIADYGLSLAAASSYLAQHGRPENPGDLASHRLVGYIPELIFDPALDYLGELGIGPVVLGSNSVAVQMNWIRQGAGLGIMHDFAVPQIAGMQRLMTDQVGLRRSFYLVRHASDRGRARMTRFSEALIRGLRAEIARLERQT